MTDTGARTSTDHLGDLAAMAPAAALTQKKCSEKYQAAKTAGTLAGKSWNDYRKTECAANAPAAAAESATKAAPAKDAPKENAQPKPAPSPLTAVFPTAVSSKYS